MKLSILRYWACERCSLVMSTVVICVYDIYTHLHSLFPNQCRKAQINALTSAGCNVWCKWPSPSWKYYLKCIMWIWLNGQTLPFGSTHLWDAGFSILVFIWLVWSLSWLVKLMSVMHNPSPSVYTQWLQCACSSELFHTMLLKNIVECIREDKISWPVWSQMGDMG